MVEVNIEYSKRLGVLTPAQLQAALDRFEIGRLVDAEAAPGGLFGQNVILRTTGGDWVLRGAPHHQWQFPWERWFSRVIRERTRAEAPWPFHIETSPEIFGWSFALMPRLPGVSLADPDVRRGLSPEERADFARAMGEHLSWMQDATFEHPGIYTTTDEVVPLDRPYGEWFIQRTREWLERCRAASAATTDDDVAWVEKVIDGARAALDVPFTPTVVHTDYTEGNVVAVQEDGRWRITGVFDLGDSHVGDGELDLARLCRLYGGHPGTLHAFLDAFAAERSLREGFGQRMALYLLADWLIIWEYGQRNGIWFTPGTTLRQSGEGFLVRFAEAMA